jgi:hypothetical protein
MTHAYFCFYHGLSNVVLRRVRAAAGRAVDLGKGPRGGGWRWEGEECGAGSSQSTGASAAPVNGGPRAPRLLKVETQLADKPLATRKAARCVVVFLLSYATAYMETLTIAHVRGGWVACAPTGRPRVRGIPGPFGAPAARQARAAAPWRAGCRASRTCLPSHARSFLTTLLWTAPRCTRGWRREAGGGARARAPRQRQRQRQLTRNPHPTPHTPPLTPTPPSPPTLSTPPSPTPTPHPHPSPHHHPQPPAWAPCSTQSTFLCPSQCSCASTRTRGTSAGRCRRWAWGRARAARRGPCRGLGGREARGTAVERRPGPSGWPRSRARPAPAHAPDAPPLSRRPQVAFDALAAGMLVTILLDTWRIAFGGIVDNDKARAGLTWAA